MRKHVPPRSFSSVVGNLSCLGPYMNKHGFFPQPAFLNSRCDFITCESDPAFGQCQKRHSRAESRLSARAEHPKYRLQLASNLFIASDLKVLIQYGVGPIRGRC
jgi:hypothetical protein